MSFVAITRSTYARVMMQISGPRRSDLNTGSRKLNTSRVFGTERVFTGVFVSGVMFSSKISQYLCPPSVVDCDFRRTCGEKCE